MNAKHRNLKAAAALLLVAMTLLPGIASAATYFSVNDGTWNSAGRWRFGAGASCAGGGSGSTAAIYPGSAASGAADVVIICTGDDITLPLSPANGVTSLETQGTGTLASATGNVALTVNGNVTNAGTISFNGVSGSFTLDINGNLANAGTISISANDRTHALSVSGNITGNGGIDLRNGSNARIVNLTLDGAGTQTLSGTGTIEFYTVTATAGGNEFEIDKAGGTVSVGSNMDLAGDLTVVDGTLTISGASGAAQSIVVDGDIDVDANGVVGIANVTLTHVLDLGGNLTNDGTFDMVFDNNSRCRVNFLGTSPVSVSGSGTTEFNIIGVDLPGGTIADLVNVTAVITMAGTGSGFVFTDGTFRLSSASSITPAAQITIPVDSRLEINDAGAVLTTATTLILNGGVLNIADTGGGAGGDVNVGDGNNENVQINDIATSELRVAGGTLDVAGRVASAVATGGSGVFNMSGGTITVGVVGNTTNAQNGAPFALGSDTTFTQSGGTIVIREANTQANAREYDVQSTTHNVTGGTLQIGDGGTAAGQTFQINSAAPVYNLTLDATNTPTTTLFAALNVNHDLTIGAGTTFNLSANQAINMGNSTAGGDWINNGGTFTPGTGTVTFNGTGPQAIGGTGSTNFTNLTDSNTDDILSVNVNTNVATTLTVNANAVLVPAAAVVINNAAPAGTITGNGTIHVTRIAATPIYASQYRFTTNTLNNLTVNFSGAGAQSVSAGFTYGGIIASNSGTKTLLGNITINNSGVLNVNTSGVTFDLSTFTANCSGAGTATVVGGATLRIGGTNGFPSGYTTTSLAATSTVEYYGAGQSVLGQTYGHLTLSGSGTKTLVTANATIGGNLTVNATGVIFDLQSFTADRSPAGGTLTVVNGATLRIGGTNGYPANYTTNTLGATSTVEYSGTNQNVLGRSYGHLTLSGSGTKTLVTANAVMAGNLSVNASGVTFDLQNLTANGSGTLLVVSGATLKIGTTGGTNGFPTGYGTVTLQSTSTVEYSGAAQTVANQAYSNLTLSGAGAKTLNAGMTSIGNIFTITAGATANAVVGLTVNGNFVLSTTTGSAFNAGNFTHQLKANFTDTSSPAGFNGSTGTVHLNGTLAQSIGGATNTVFNNLQITNAAGASLTGGVTKTVNGTLTLSSGTFSVGGNTLVLNGPAIAGTVTNLATTSASNLTFGGTSTPLTVPTNVTALNNLTVTKTVGTLSLGANVAISGDLSVTGSGGTLDLVGFTANRASAGGTLTVSDGATLRIGGTSTTFPSNYSTVSLGGTSTVVYYGTGQTIGNYNYGNLTLSGSGTNTSGGTTTVAGSLQIGNGVIYDLGSTSLTGSGGSATISVANGGTLRIGGTNGFPSGFSGTPTLGATSTVEYYGSNQNVRGLAYGHLTLSGTATKTLVTANATIAGNLTLNTSGVTFDLDTFTCNGTGGGATILVGSGTTLKIGGTNTFPSGYATTTVNGGSTVEYSGTTQNVTNLAYGTLTVSGSGTKTVTGGDASVSGVLNLNAGVLATGVNQLTIGTAGSVTRGGGCGGTSCFVAGNLTKNVPAGTPTVNWEVGSATPSPAYAPVSIAFTGAAAGNFRVTAPAAAADHADVTAELAGIDPALSVNRYWTLTRLTGSATSYAPTFAYGNIAGDLDPGTTPANFIVAQKSTGFWEYPTLVGTPTGSSAAVTGVIDANGDDFAIGEPKLTNAPISRWLMDQTSWNGTPNEVLDTAGGYNGTASGISTRPNTDASTPPIAGNPGTCQYGVFDRANKDYIALPGFPNLNTAAGAFTITAWVRSTAVGNSGQRIMVDDEGNANGNWGFSLGDAGAGQLRFFYRQGATFILDTPGGSPLVNNTWYFVAVAMRLKAGGNSSKGEIFVFNTAGALHATAKANFTVTSFTTDTTPASIGGETNASGENTSAFGFGGNIDMVSVFNTDLSRQHVNLVRQTTAPCIFLDHIRLTHDGIGLTCAPETVTITACSDPACSLQYTGNVDTTLSPAGWVGGDAVNFSGGSTTRNLQITTPGIVTLGASSTTPTPAGSARCFIGLVENCNLEFKDSGFIFDVPNQTACKTSAAVTISAVRTDLTSQTCAPAFSGARTVNFWSTYINPASGGSAVSVSGTPVAGASPGTGVALNFNASAQATVTVQYPDAGQMQLDARYDGAGAEAGLVMTGNDQFVSSPVGLAVYAADDCPAGDATCGVFGKAGADFDLNVKAACWVVDGDTDLSDNPSTPNFALAGIPVSHTLVAPVLGASGGIGVTTFDFTTADAGIHTLDQSVTEVGVFAFTVTPANYFGQPLAVATSPSIGRFTPARLNITPNMPEFAHSCDGTGDDFTYMEQPFYFATAPELTVTGLNAAGNITQNYGGEGLGGSDFWMLDSLLENRDYDDPDRSAFGPTPGLSDATLSDADDYDGTGKLTLPAGSGGDLFMYDRGATVEPPFNAEVDAIFPAADLKDDTVDYDVCYDPDLNNTCDPFTISDITGTGSGTAQLRFGRLVIGTAAGSELLPLAVRMEAEYFNGTAFILNADDTGSCSAIPTAEVETSGSACAAGATTPTVAHSPLLGGQAGLSLSAPGATCTGDVNISVDLSQGTGVDLEWLRYDWDGNGAQDNDPTGRASFGVFGGNENLIYIREPWN